MNIVFLTFIVFLFPGLCLGESFEYQGLKFTLTFSSEWKPAEMLFGVPVTLLGPFQQKTENRPVIQIIPVEKPKWVRADQDFDKMGVEGLTKFGKEYIELRKIWLKKVNGKVIEEHPSEVFKTEAGSPMLQTGISYQIGPKSFAVKTSYIGCKNKLINLRIFLHAGHEKYLPEAQKILRSFKCE